MSELGGRLRQARTDKGLSIDDVQSITKIQKRYLIGLEEGNYESMPGPFYIRAFIRQYAEAVGLNSEELLNDHKNELPNASKAAAPQMAATSIGRKNYRGGNRLMEVFPMILVALFVIAILVIAYMLSQRAPVDSPADVPDENEIILETQQPDEEEPAVTEETEEETEEPVEETVPEVTITPTSNQGEDSYYDVTGAETATVRIEFTGDSWLSIRRDSLKGELLIPTEAVYTVADSPFTFELPEPGTYRIRLGFKNRAKVFVNDQEVPYQATGSGTSENLYLNWIK